MANKTIRTRNPMKIWQQSFWVSIEFSLIVCSAFEFGDAVAIEEMWWSFSVGEGTSWFLEQSFNGKTLSSYSITIESLTTYPFEELRRSWTIISLFLGPKFRTSNRMNLWKPQASDFPLYVLVTIWESINPFWRSSLIEHIVEKWLPLKNRGNKEVVYKEVC